MRTPPAAAVTVLASLGLPLLFGLLGPGTASAQAADPFRVRNLNPPVAVFGLPTWDPLPEAPAFGATAELANHYRLSQRGNERLILDGETLRLTLSYERPVGERWSVSAELPAYRLSGGRLDDIVDGWHSFFGPPDGGRNNRPENAFLFELAAGAGPALRLDGGGSGIGDLKLSVARRLGGPDGFVLRAAVELPTGDESILAGNGSTDWSLTLLDTRSRSWRGRDTGYYWGVGVLGLGDVDRIPFTAEDNGVVALLGGGLAIRARLGLKAQIDVHSPLYDSPLEEIGQTAVQATLGGWWTLPRGVLDFAVVEDLHVSTVPDVVLHMTLRWRL